MYIAMCIVCIYFVYTRHVCVYHGYMEFGLKVLMKLQGVFKNNFSDIVICSLCTKMYGFTVKKTIFFTLKIT